MKKLYYKLTHMELLYTIIFLFILTYPSSISLTYRNANIFDYLTLLFACYFYIMSGINGCKEN